MVTNQELQRAKYLCKFYPKYELTRLKRKLFQSGYECKKAFDQIIGYTDTGHKENENGWSIKSSNPLPQWVEFTLRDVSKVNSVALKSLWPGEKYRPKGFKIELYKEGKVK